MATVPAHGHVISTSRIIQDIVLFIVVFQMTESQKNDRFVSICFFIILLGYC